MTSRKMANAPGDLVPLHQATPAERTAMQTYLKERDSKPTRPNVTVTSKNGVAEIRLDHADPALAQVLLCQALGTTDVDFFGELMKQIANISGKGPTPCEATLNFNLAVIEGIRPRDQMEAMLAAQMAAVHSATMTFARRLAHVENLPQQDGAERAFNKLARTFAVQMETLKRYRTGGEQKVTVQHVTVNDGGQAIVGAVAPTAGGVGHPKNAAPTP